MKMILNEKAKVDGILNTGKINNKKPMCDIRLLVKYYFSIGLDKIQVRDSIEDFLKKNYRDFNEVLWMRRLDDLVKSVSKQKHELFIIEEVCVTQNELNTIKNIKSKMLEKLAFVLLVYAKIYNHKNNNQNNWVNADLKEIFQDVKMKINKNDQAIMVGKLMKLGLVTKSRQIDNTNLKILFVDNDYSSEIIIKIIDFKSFIGEYLKWIGEKINKCVDCGEIIKKSSNRQKYCKECWNKKEKENARNGMRKLRNLKKC